MPKNKAMWPDGALGVADVNTRCMHCHHRGSMRRDYYPKYKFPSGVYHVNCHANVQLLRERFVIHLNEKTQLFSGTVGSLKSLCREGLAEVVPCASHNKDDSVDDDWSDSLCDAHLAVLWEE